MNHDDWWKIRCFLKPKVYNPASPMSLRQWENVKHDFKKRLKKFGYQETFKQAAEYVQYRRSKYL